MEGNLKKYLEGMAPSLPPEIISIETFSHISKLAAHFSDFAASEYIMETYLNSEAGQADFSFRVLAEERICLIKGLKGQHLSNFAADEKWARVISFVNAWPQGIDDIWFEMDYGQYEKQIPQPCFFFNARQIKKGTELDEQLLFAALKQLLAREQLQLLWPNLKGVVQQLPPAVGLFQVGVMLARHSDRVRLFTAELTKEQTIEYLTNLGWTGSLSRVADLLQLVQQYSDGQYIVDFDVSQQGISEKIGINFGLVQKETLPAFVETLVKRQLCTDVKRRGVLAWPGSKGSFLGKDYGYTALIKDISHFKIGYSPEEGLKVKAYLRVAGIYMKQLFTGKALKPPVAKPEQLGYQS